MTSMSDMHRMMHGEQESHDEYMRRAQQARAEDETNMGMMFESMAKDELKHRGMMESMADRMGMMGEPRPIYPSMPTSMPSLMEYYWVVDDKTTGNRTVDGTRYDSVNVATAEARRYITQDLAVNEDIQGHTIVVEVWLSPPLQRTYAENPFHTESFRQLETVPLSKMMPTSQVDYNTLAEDIKAVVGEFHEDHSKANFHIGVLLGLEEGSESDSKRWLTDKGVEHGLL